MPLCLVDVIISCRYNTQTLNRTLLERFRGNIARTNETVQQFVSNLPPSADVPVEVRHRFETRREIFRAVVPNISLEDGIKVIDDARDVCVHLIPKSEPITRVLAFSNRSTVSAVPNVAYLTWASIFLCSANALIAAAAVTVLGCCFLPPPIFYLTATPGPAEVEGLVPNCLEVDAAEVKNR